MGSEFVFERLARVNEVCPICGKKDWCARLHPHDDLSATLYLCMRPDTAGFNQQPKTKFQSSYNGNEYVVVKVSNSVMIQELNEWMSRHPGRKLLDGTVAPQGMAQTYQPKKVVYEEKTPLLPPDELDKRYRKFLSQLVLEQKDRDYLYSEGFTDAMIERYTIRSIPEPDGFRYANKTYRSNNKTRKQIMFALQQEFGEALAGTPGFYMKDDGSWTFNGPGGLIIPIPDIHGRYIGMRIRVDRRWHDLNGYCITKEQYLKDKANAERLGRPCPSTEMGKYVWMSSYKEDQKKAAQGIIGNRYKFGVSSGCPAGYYYPTTTGNAHGREAVIMTEGEKKSIVASEYQGLMTIDIPGVGNWRQLFIEDETGERPIDVLKKSGVKCVIVAYDADKENNRQVLAQQNMLVESLYNEGMMVAIAGWDIDIGKGLDDLLVKGGKPELELVYAKK